MHDEFERALGVRRRPGLSFLGWVGVAFSLLVVLTGIGGWLAYRAVADEARRMAEQIQLSSGPDLVARTVAETMGAVGAAPSVEREALAVAVQRTLADRDASDGPSLLEAGPEDDVEGFLRIRTPDGELTADLRADGSGGALVVRGADGNLLLDLSADQAGGRLWVRGEGEVARFDTGAAAERAPTWLPPVGPRRAFREPVLTGRAGGSGFGASTWLSEEAPAAVVGRFRTTLMAEGWEISAEHHLEGRDEAQASVVAQAPGTGRTVVLAAEEEEGATRVVLGWGEADRGVR